MVGEYRIEAALGEGGMGTVHGAVHPLIGKPAGSSIRWRRRRRCRAIRIRIRSGPSATTTGTGGALAVPPVDGHDDVGPRVTAAVHPGRGKRIAGLVTIGVGVALGATGGYFSSQARQAARDVEDACAAGCVADDLAGRDADGKAAERNATIFYAAGGVAVAAGIAAVVWGWHDGRAHARHLAVRPSTTGAVAVAAWSF